MEIKTVKQVSKDYGISNRMLCYYEEIGLIKSSRKNDYAYRVYDETAIKRLQQIIILRKLQIPMKQIKDILDNPTAVAVIEIFKQNIDALDEQITALSVVKSILARFVDELQEKADIRLKLDILNDKTMLAVVNSLSFSENKISKVKESLSMEELNKASEILDKYTNKDVRIVNLPPMTWASASGTNCRDVLKKFIDDVDLFEIKHDTRIFGFDAFGVETNASTVFASIPNDLEVPAPLEKIDFYGGLYAMCRGIDKFDIDYWTKNNDEYEWAPENGINRPIMEEFPNPYNRFGSGLQYTYSDIYYPIKKIEKATEEQKEEIKTALAELAETFSHGKTTEIDLTSMIKNGDFRLEYSDGLMIIKNENYEGKMETPQRFKLPLKIELRAKTNSTDIDIGYANNTVLFDHFHFRNNLFVEMDGDTTYKLYKKCGVLPVDEFVDIEWILGKEMMAVKVNGELRHTGNDYGYIKAFSENPEYTISSAVQVYTMCGATVTVEKLRVTEL